MRKTDTYVKISAYVTKNGRICVIYWPIFAYAAVIVAYAFMDIFRMYAGCSGREIYSILYNLRIFPHMRAVLMAD